MRSLLSATPVGLSFITSSATTYQGKPPSFDVLYLDPETMRPVDYEVHYLDLETANAKDEVNWSLYLDYRTAYNLTDMRPSNTKTLCLRLRVSPEAFSRAPSPNL